MARNESLDPKLFVALDVDDPAKAIELAKELAMLAVGFKLGPRLVNKAGAEIIHSISQHGPVFVDHKFFDIPSTMISAVRAVAEAGATYVTVHAMAGPSALQELKNFEAELQKQGPFRILAVTVLTSFHQESLPTPLQKTSIANLVEQLAKDVFAAGLQGVVASAHESKAIRNLNEHAFIVTPGVRLAEGATHDQSRTVTPDLAWKNGSSAIVVGRPILKAENKSAAVQRFLQGS